MRPDPVSRFLNVNLPLVWRTRIHLYLPLFLVLDAALWYMGRSAGNSFRNIPIKPDPFLMTVYWIYPVIGFLLWLVQVMQIPLQSRSPKSLVLSFILFYTGCFTLLLGRKFYAWEAIPSLAKLASDEQLARDIGILETCGKCNTDTSFTKRLNAYGYSSQIPVKRYPVNRHPTFEHSAYSGELFDMRDSTVLIGFDGQHSSLEALYRRLLILREAKRFMQGVPSTFSKYRFLEPGLFVLPLLPALIILIASSSMFVLLAENIRSGVAGILSWIPRPSRFLATWERGICRRNPMWWAMGLHIGALALLIFSGICGLYGLFSWNYGESMDSVSYPFFLIVLGFIIIVPVIWGLRFRAMRLPEMSVVKHYLHLFLVTMVAILHIAVFAATMAIEDDMNKDTVLFLAVIVTFFMNIFVLMKFSGISAAMAVLGIPSLVYAKNISSWDLNTATFAAFVIFTSAILFVRKRMAIWFQPLLVSLLNLFVIGFIYNPLAGSFKWYHLLWVVVWPLFLSALLYNHQKLALQPAR